MAKLSIRFFQYRLSSKLHSPFFHDGVHKQFMIFTPNHIHRVYCHCFGKQTLFIHVMTQSVFNFWFCDSFHTFVSFSVMLMFPFSIVSFIFTRIEYCRHTMQLWNTLWKLKRKLVYNTSRRKISSMRELIVV